MTKTYEVEMAPKAPKHGGRFRDALAIVDPGACNPSGIAHSIVDACQEIRAHEPHNAATSQICDDAAVRLMVYQLASLINGVAGPVEFYSSNLIAADQAHCKRRLAELGLKPFGA